MTICHAFVMLVTHFPIGIKFVVYLSDCENKIGFQRKQRHLINNEYKQ